MGNIEQELEELKKIEENHINDDVIMTVGGAFTTLVCVRHRWVKW